MSNNNYEKSKSTFNKAPKGGESESRSILHTEDIQPIQAKPLEVKVYGNFEKASKAFRAMVQKDRILSIYKEKQSFEKPSDKKRRKKNESRRKAFEMTLKNNDRSKKSKRKERRQ